MIKWLKQHQEAYQPATYRTIRNEADYFGKIVVISADRRTGMRVVEVFAGNRPVLPIFDGSRAERKRLIKQTKPTK